MENNNSWNEIDEDENENPLMTIDNFREKIRRSGVVYISYIPIGMTVALLREKLSQYGVNRIYLIPEKEKKSLPNGKKVTAYKEGWVEFEEKMYAKLCEYELNGKMIGGTRNCAFKEELWTIKYLKKFKWHLLMEKMNFNKKLREQRLKTEIAQARRENNFILKNFEMSKMLNKKKQRGEIIIEEEAGENQQKEPVKEENEEKGSTDENPKRRIIKLFKRHYRQKVPIIKKKTQI